MRSVKVKAKRMVDLESKKMTGHQLRVQFREFNDRYFRGRLPSYHIRVVDRMTSLGESGRIFRRRRLIEIQRGIDDPIETLLHEMVHAATNDAHSRAFAAELKRLIEAGAPVAKADINYLEIFPVGTGTRMSPQKIRCAFEHALLDQPTATFPQVVRWMIRVEGGARSVAEFSRRYPWARKLFRKCYQDRLEHQNRRAGFRAKWSAANGGV